MERTSEVMGDLSIMQVAQEQGPWLTFTVRQLGVRHAVEVGTFTGYSALCIAEGLPTAVACTASTSTPSTWMSVARSGTEAGVAGRIDVTIGPALETLRSLPTDDPIDLAFIDADKENYGAYYEELLARLAPGGLIVADNALWSAAVLDGDSTDPSTVAIVSLQRHGRRGRPRRRPAAERRRRPDAGAQTLTPAGGSDPASRTRADRPPLRWAHRFRSTEEPPSDHRDDPRSPRHRRRFRRQGRGDQGGLHGHARAGGGRRAGPHDKIALLYVLGEEFTGYSGGAMWEDTKIGTENLSKWEKIAVVSDTKWVSESVGLFGHLMPGKIKVFSNAEEAEARAWVGA